MKGTWFDFLLVTLVLVGLYAMLDAMGVNVAQYRYFLKPMLWGAIIFESFLFAHDVAWK